MVSVCTVGHQCEFEIRPGARSLLQANQAELQLQDRVACMSGLANQAARASELAAKNTGPHCECAGHGAFVAFYWIYLVEFLCSLPTARDAPTQQYQAIASSPVAVSSLCFVPVGCGGLGLL